MRCDLVIVLMDDGLMFSVTANAFGALALGFDSNLLGANLNVNGAGAMSTDGTEWNYFSPGDKYWVSKKVYIVDQA